MRVKYSKYISATIIGITGIMIAACDEVKPDNRYIYEEPVQVERTVLLEDFTGQMCLNCPEAHEEIETLEAEYGKDKIIPVSIHCGSFGLSVNNTNFARNSVFLMTDEGNAILETYGISSFPMGVIDMGKPMVYELWKTGVRDAIQVPTDVTIDNLEAVYMPSPTDNGTEYHGSINVKVDVTSGSDREANVQFWVIESGIVAMQRLPNGSFKQDYVHNNVFRAQIFDGVKGQKFAFDRDVVKSISGSIESRWNEKERWEISNLEVVAIISDGTGVLQCKKVKLRI